MRALDLFCGGGGVSVGLARAGFEVTGVDLNPAAEKYWRRGMEPYCGEFVCADALAYPIKNFAFVWASPPCQAHSSLRHLVKDKVYPDLIAATRARLVASGIPYCIENVPGAPLGASGYLIELCGSMFDGLHTADGRAELKRHRHFETSFSIPLRPQCQHGHVSQESLSVTGSGMGVGNRGKHAAEQAKRRALNVTGHAVEVSPTNWGKRKVLTVCGHTPVDNEGRRAVITVSGDRPNCANTPRAISVTGNTPQTNAVHKQVRQTYSTDDGRAAMGIDWLPMAWLSQAIPPLYATWIAKQFLATVKALQQAAVEAP